MITVEAVRRRRLVDRKDCAVAAAAVTLVAVAALVGGLLYLDGRPVQASAAPFYAHWLPHVGPGTPIAVVVAVLVVWWGPMVAARLSWRALLGAAYVVTVVWTLGLALVDGWQRGLAGRLTTTPEYLHDVPRVSDVSVTVSEFTGRILDFQPDSWTTHVAGHPPGALLVFVWLERLGLGGGGWAALACVLVGSLAAVAVPETVRLLGGSSGAARAVVPFAVLFPGAVWVGASADGLFAGVTAVGVMLLARGLLLPAVGGGALLGFGVYLSYGLVLLAPVVLVALLAGRQREKPGRRRGWSSWRRGRSNLRQGRLGLERERPSLEQGRLGLERGRPGLERGRAGLRRGWPNLRPAWLGARQKWVSAESGDTAAPASGSALTAWGGAVVGAALVVAAFTAAGFWWLDGYHLVVERYYQGLASVRPYAYWVWANLAALVACAGPAVAVVLRRVLADRSLHVTRLLPLAAAAAIVVADVSGLSKAETERIWLPFAVWFSAGAALVPTGSRRFWLAVQAGTALLVNHLLLTSW